MVVFARNTAAAWSCAALTLLLAACGGGGGGGDGDGSGGDGSGGGGTTTPNYSIGGTLSGLASGDTVVLQDNGGNNTAVAANGSISFTTPIESGSTYAVTVLTQPTGEGCSVTNGSGTASANVTNVTVDCSGNSYNISATVAGLATGATVVLQDNGAGNLTVSANGTSNFNTPIVSGSVYAVTILTQPAGETCSVANGSGTVTSANVTIAVTCAPISYSVGGSVSGLLTGTSLALQDNGANTTAVTANGSFTFTTPVASGAAYAVTVVTQPAGQTCTIANGSGAVVSANIANVAVTCSTNTYPIGGTVTGLTGTGLTLQDNGGDNLAVATGGAFTFNTPVASGSPYAATILTQPSGQSCSVVNGSGTVSTAPITNINITCAGAAPPNAGLWTWVGGADTIQAYGTYGTQGTPAAGNWPGARYYASSWTDTAGNFWLFGGSGAGSPGSGGVLNDLWKYSPTSGEWAWMSGSQTGNTTGNFGTQGVASGGNVPGSRSQASTWIDAAGNLWLFGGLYLSANGPLNDLWKYSPGTGEWTWVSGSNVGYAHGVYGTQGTPAAGNVPGARQLASSWTDSSGNLWLFGGQGYDSAGNSGLLNDLWKFAPGSGLWTWMSGANTINATGSYGTQGTAAAGNVPVARWQSVSWADAAGNLWLFGGSGYIGGPSVQGNGNLNDLWEYSITTGLWTWVNGSNQLNTGGVAGNYGTQGVPASTNQPASRGSAVAWIDATGNLWFYGGYDGDTFDDLWEYSPTSGLWTWVAGSKTTNTLVDWGTQGVAAANNQPGGRFASVSWIDSAGHLWLFGGEVSAAVGNYAPFPDLWEYVP